jgi:hypothetical protein
MELQRCRVTAAIRRDEALPQDMHIRDMHIRGIQEPVQIKSDRHLYSANLRTRALIMTVRAKEQP